MSPVSQILVLFMSWLVIGTTMTTSVAPVGAISFLLLPVIYWALVFRGSGERAGRAAEKLNSTLMQGENVVLYALQRRISALIHRRELLALTSSRVILIDRSLFGGFAMRDYQWKDLHDADLAENMLPQLFGSRLSFAVGQSSKIVIDGVPSDAASKVYSHAQAQEQAWEEKRRVRALEDMRAAAGGVVVHGAGAPANSNDMFAELEKAKRLLDAGAISDAEYQEIKSKILSKAS